MREARNEGEEGEEETGRASERELMEEGMKRNSYLCVGIGK